jgi:hypothetical protein
MDGPWRPPSVILEPPAPATTAISWSPDVSITVSPEETALTNPPGDVTAALRRGREAVDEFTAFWLDEGEMWREESATDVLCWRASPHLRPVTFNRHQEGHVGADWLWWFVDADTGTAFGMLCQAKNLKRLSPLRPRSGCEAASWWAGCGRRSSGADAPWTVR